MLKVEPSFIGFENAEDVFKEFQVPVDSKVKFCYACYDQGGYDGSAFIIYYRTDTRKYYEAHASHCSCYGLEGQWSGDEEVVFEELEKRLSSHYSYEVKLFGVMYEKYLQQEG